VTVWVTANHGNKNYLATVRQVSLAIALILKLLNFLYKLKKYCDSDLHVTVLEQILSQLNSNMYVIWFIYADTHFYPSRFGKELSLSLAIWRANTHVSVNCLD